MQCKGWIRTGGAFTFGRPEWKQCKNEAIVMIEFKYPDEKIETLPGCSECWRKCIDQENLNIISVRPI